MVVAREGLLRPLLVLVAVRAQVIIVQHPITPSIHLVERLGEPPVIQLELV